MGAAGVGDGRAVQDSALLEAQGEDVGEGFGDGHGWRALPGLDEREVSLPESCAACGFALGEPRPYSGCSKEGAEALGRCASNPDKHL